MGKDYLLASVLLAAAPACSQACFLGLHCFFQWRREATGSVARGGRGMDAALLVGAAILRCPLDAWRVGSRHGASGYECHAGQRTVNHDCSTSRCCWSMGMSFPIREVCCQLVLLWGFGAVSGALFHSMFAIAALLCYVAAAAGPVSGMVAGGRSVLPTVPLLTSNLTPWLTLASWLVSMGKASLQKHDLSVQASQWSQSCSC